jgi:hypothetical protein
MIDFRVYDKINDYCISNKLPKIYRKLLYYKYVEEMKGLIESYKTKNANDPNNDILTGFDDSCLSDERLSNNVKLVADEIKDVTDSEVKKFKKRQSRKEFWLSVWASVLASFIFVISAITVYKVGEDQFNSWIGDNNEPKSSTTTEKHIDDELSDLQMIKDSEDDQ